MISTKIIFLLIIILFAKCVAETHKQCAGVYSILYDVAHAVWPIFLSHNDDDVKLYSSFAYNSHDLQVVCDRLAVWAEEWQLRIAYNKCISHRISNRAAADGNSSYGIGSHVLCWSDETRDI